MPRNVNINIAGQDLNLTASDAQQEHDMRVAADAINSRLRELDATYNGGTPLSKLAFVALGEATSRVGYQRLLESVGAEVSELDTQLDSYLRNKK